MTSTDEVELRADIKLCHDLDLTPTQTLGTLQKAVGNAANHWCFKWYGCFHEDS